MLGDALLRLSRSPVRELGARTGPMLRAVTKRKGAPMRERAKSLTTIASAAWAAREQGAKSDPVERARQSLQTDSARLQELEEKMAQEIEQTAF